MPVPSPRVVLLAALGPALVLGLAASVLLRPVPPKLSNRAVELERRLAAAPPDIVLLGNSAARGAVDPALLSSLLPDDLPKIVDLSVAGTGGSTWYAVLRNRVQANGYRPRLVVVLSHYRFLVDTQPFIAKNLDDQMVGDEIPILEKTFGVSASVPLVHRAEQRRDDLRARLLGALRYGSARLLPGVDGGAPDVQASVDDALARVFTAEGATDLALHRRAIPIVEERKDELGGAVVGSVRDGFVPDLVDLADAMGSRILFVLLPLPSTSSVRPPDAAELRDLLTLLNERGAGWLDLSAPDCVSDASFADHVHLALPGRQCFTRELARRLDAMDALQGDQLPPATLPLGIQEAARTGAVPGLPAPRATPDDPCAVQFAVPWVAGLGPRDLARRKVGAGILPFRVSVQGTSLPVETRTEAGTCAGSWRIHRGALVVSPAVEGVAADLAVEVVPDFPFRAGGDGDAWWIFPGSTAHLTLGDAWTPDRGPFRVTAVGLSGTAGDEPVVLAVPGVGEVPFRVQAGVARADLRGEAPPAPWRVEVRSPAGGPTILLRSLVVGEKDGASVLLGTKEGVPSRSFNLLPTSRTPTVTATFSAPPDLPLGTPVTRGGVTTIPAPAWEFLRGPKLKAATQWLSCDPARLVDRETREPVGQRVACSGLARATGTAWCHGEGRFQVVAPGGEDPGRWTVDLDPSRLCARRAMWLYPGDRVRLQVDRQHLGVEGDSLLLGAYVLPGTGDDGPLHLVLRTGQEVVWEEEIPLSGIARRDSIPLGRRLPARVPDLSVELSTPATAAWIALGRLSLSEQAAFSSDDAAGDPGGVPDDPVAAPALPAIGRP